MERFPLTDYEILEVIRRRGASGVSDRAIQKWLRLSGVTWAQLVREAEEGST